MSTPAYEILDQAVALKFNMKKKQISSTTQIRIKILDHRTKHILLNAKQLKITEFRLHSIQLYNKKKDKLKKKFLDNRFRSKIIYISPNEQILINSKLLQEECPHNIPNFENFSNQFENFENHGFVSIYWWLQENDKYNKEMDRIFSSGYNIYFNLEIKSKIDNPQGPSSFQVIDNKLLFFKNSTFGSCRNLFPCKDEIRDKYFFSKIKITIENSGRKFVPICSGKLEKVVQCDGSFCYTFNIARKINPAFLGLVVGEFVRLKAECFVQNFWTLNPEFFKNGKNDNIWRAIKRSEKFLFNYNDSLTEIVFIPGLTFWNSIDLEENNYTYKINPFFYHNFFMINQDFFMEDRYLESNSYFFSEFLIYKFLSRTLELITFYDLNSFWILIGTACFIKDKIVHLVYGKSSSDFFLYKKRRKYFELTEKGKDIHPINKPHFFNSNQIYYDEVYTLKCNLAINVLIANLKLDFDNINNYFDFFQDEFILSTKSFLEKLKNLYRVKGLKRHMKTFIDFSGTMEINLSYSYDRKKNNIRMYVRQNSLPLKYFQEMNEKRFKIEKYYEYLTEGNKIVQKIKKELEEKLEKYESIFLPKIKREIDSIVLVNKNRNTLKKTEIKMPYLLIESSEKDYSVEIDDFPLESIEKEFFLTLKSKFKKNNNSKKKNYLSEKNSIKNEKKKDDKSSIYDSCIINKINREGLEKFSFKILLDPYNTFLFKISTKESEEVLLDQFEKGVKERTELPNLFYIIESMEIDDSLNLMNKFCYYLNIREIPIYVKLLFLEILDKKKDSSPISRVSDILFNIIQTLKFDSDGTLKPNNFNKFQNFFFFLKLMKVLIRYDESIKILESDEETENDDTIVFLIMNLLKKNDNSINQKDDSYYQAFIIQCLLNCKNSRFFPTICEELLRYIKIEFYNKPKSKYMITVIFKYFGQFVVNNLKVMHYNLYPNKKNKFSLLEIFTENENLKSILGFFLKLKKTYRTNPMIVPYIFRHKLFVKEFIKGYKLSHIFIYSLKKIKSRREKFGSVIGNCLLNELLVYLETKKEKIENLQMDLNLKEISTISKLIWDQMTCQISIVDSKFRYNFMKIYHLFFNEFVPISLYEKEKNVLFPIDRYWLEISNRIELNRYYNKKKKNVVFKFLSLQKKTKKGQIISPPRNFKYNIREIILQNFKVNKETLTKRNMAKHIINILLTEKIIMEIENKINTQNGNYVKQPLIRDIKKRLMKSEIGSLQVLKEEIYYVVDFFRINNLVDDNVYMEFINFVNLLVSEANYILQEKTDNEKKKIENMKIRISFKKE